MWEGREKTGEPGPPRNGTSSERDEGGTQGLASLTVSPSFCLKHHKEPPPFLPRGACKGQSQTGDRGSGWMVAGPRLSTGSDHGGHQVAWGRLCRWQQRASRSRGAGRLPLGQGRDVAWQCVGWEGGPERSARPVSSLDAQMGVSRGFCCLRKLALPPAPTAGAIYEKQMLDGVGVRGWG